MENSAISLLKMWCQNTDVQSCIRFLWELVSTEGCLEVRYRCLSQLNKPIQQRMVQDWNAPELTKEWNGLLTMVMEKERQTLIDLKLTATILQLVGRNARIRAFALQYVNTTILHSLHHFQTVSSELLQFCKQAYKIWRYISALQSEFLRPVLLTMAMKLQELTLATEFPPLRVVFSVLLVTLMQYIGVNYHIKFVLEYVDSASQELQKTHIYEGLFVYRDWERLNSGKKSFFRVRDLPLFQSVSVPTSLPEIDLSEALQHIAHRSATQGAVLTVHGSNLEVTNSFHSSVIHTSDFTPHSQQIAEIQLDFQRAAERGSWEGGGKVE